MAVNLSQDIIEALKKLSEAQQRGLDEIVDDAVREYLVSISITDVSPEQISETQLALAAELSTEPYDQQRDEK